MTGIKYDQDKLRIDLIPPAAIIGIAQVLTYGAKKYSPDNWKHVESWRYRGAALRHLYAYLAGETNDPESGLNHLDHAIASIIFIRELEGKKND